VSFKIDYIDSAVLAPFRNERADETHVADVINLADASKSLDDNLLQAKALGVRYVIIGVPEDIGPRGNRGNAGATQGWDLFVSSCMRRQANHFFDWTQCMFLGALNLRDLQLVCESAELETLRAQCETVDKRVSWVARRIFEHGLEAIVIGGGHNNAFPLIQALSETKNNKVACSNLDPHADMRALEGRHSGNPFSYAQTQDYLGYYHVLGLHEQKNNQATLDFLSKGVGSYTSYQSLFIENTIAFEQAVGEVKHAVHKTGMPVGVELDLDAIKYTPASAYSICGFSIEQASHYLYQMAQLERVCYCHLSEGAIADANSREELHLGQTLAELTYSFLIGRDRRLRRKDG